MIGLFNESFSSAYGWRGLDLPITYAYWAPPRMGIRERWVTPFADGSDSPKPFFRLFSDYPSFSLFPNRKTIPVWGLPIPSARPPCSKIHRIPILRLFSMATAVFKAGRLGMSIAQEAGDPLHSCSFHSLSFRGRLQPLRSKSPIVVDWMISPTSWRSLEAADEVCGFPKRRWKKGFLRFLWLQRQRQKIVELGNDFYLHQREERLRAKKREELRNLRPIPRYSSFRWSNKIVEKNIPFLLDKPYASGNFSFQNDPGGWKGNGWKFFVEQVSGQNKQTRDEFPSLAPSPIGKELASLYAAAEPLPVFHRCVRHRGTGFHQEGCKPYETPSLLIEGKVTFRDSHTGNNW